jgi:ribosomal protein S28E/S33
LCVEAFKKDAGEYPFFALVHVCGRVGLMGILLMFTVRLLKKRSSEIILRRVV